MSKTQKYMTNKIIFIVLFSASIYSCNNKKAEVKKLQEQGVLDHTKNLIIKLYELEKMGSEMKKLREKMNSDSSIKYSFKIDTFRIDTFRSNDTMKVIIADGK